MTFRTFVNMVRRRAILIGAVAGGITLAVLIFSLLSPTIYQATATLFVSIRSGEVKTDIRLVGAERIDSYAELATSRRVFSSAAEDPEVDREPSEFDVAVYHPPRSVLIEVSARDGDPEQAAAVANAVAAATAKMVETLEDPKDNRGRSSPFNVSVAEPAAPPATPASPKVLRNVLFGLIIGIAFALAAAVIREIFDRRLRDPAAVRDLLDLPVLAAVDFDKRIKVHPLLLQKNDLDEEVIAQDRLAEMWSHSRVVEEFRQLRVNLQFFDFGESKRSIMVTSSRPGEGKSTVAGNLAVTMALAGESVVLIDCDLRKPSIARNLGIEREAGLTDVLIGRSSLDDALVSGRRLSALSAGAIPPNPTELLGSQAMADVMTELHERFDVVIVDTPPCLPFADPAVLAPLCGATLLVVRMGYTNTEDLERADITLRGSQARLCGAVSNMVSRRTLGGGSYDYYYYYGAYGNGEGSAADIAGSGFSDLRPRNRANGFPAGDRPVSRD